ncbi:MAG: 7-cyano-7-deazaguanine synthase QueC [Desulfobulbaceae bacterium A2]|nr:MAG: 7-cyano-7-deazaguanine synthase QueC [Desulfobulbaceae bacterium A2]
MTIQHSPDIVSPAAEKAVVLLSGGLDSTTVLAIARAAGYRCHTLSFHYGQRQQAELALAEESSRRQGAEAHLVLRLDLDRIGGSALTSTIEVPKDRPIDEMEHGIPVTYVPARNIIFLAHALAWAEVLEARHIFLGVNAIDYSGYPDCRPEFIEAFARMANLGTKAGANNRGFSIHTPLIRMSKGEIIRQGLRLGVDYSRTHTCYDPQDGLACGRCDACRLRRKGFAEAGLADPLPYLEP